MEYNCVSEMKHREEPNLLNQTQQIQLDNDLMKTFVKKTNEPTPINYNSRGELTVLTSKKKKSTSGSHNHAKNRDTVFSLKNSKILKPEQLALANQTGELSKSQNLNFVNVQKYNPKAIIRDSLYIEHISKAPPEIQIQGDFNSQQVQHLVMNGIAANNQFGEFRNPNAILSCHQPKRMNRLNKS